MKTIDQCSIEELEKAIEKKKEVARSASIPQPIANPDFSKVLQMLEEDLKQRAKLGPGYFNDSDFKHWLYEEAYTAVYGKEIFKWMLKTGV